MRWLMAFVMAGGCLVAQAPLPKADTWTAFQEDWIKAPHAPLTLVGSEAVLSPKFRCQDDETIRLLACEDLACQPLTEAEWTGLMASREATSSRWVALDPQGQVLGEGTAMPRGEALGELLRDQGQTSAWEALERFLADNPDNGDALVKRLSWSHALAESRIRSLMDQRKAERQTAPDGFNRLVRFKNDDDADMAYLDVSETLERLARLPDAWRFQNPALLYSVLQNLHDIPSGRLRTALGLMSEIILEAWQRYPQSGGTDDVKNGLDFHGLGSYWFACQLGAQEKIPMVPMMAVAPDQVWLPVGLFMTARVFLSGRWEALLTFLDTLPMPDLSRINVASIQKEAANYLAWLQDTRLDALIHLERWAQATETLQSLRQINGKSWPEKAARIQASVIPPDPKTSGLLSQRPTPPQSFLEVLQQPAIPAAKSPSIEDLSAPKPLQIVVWGSEPRAEVIDADALAPWGPGEATWRLAGESDLSIFKRLGFAPPC